MVRNRAWSWWYLVRYGRFFWLKVTRPHIVTEGFVFLGPRVDLFARRGYGRLVLGRWVHLGGGNALRAHEGTLRIGDKCVFGRDTVVNCYLDVEVGAATIVADWVYVCDFDHVHTDVGVPIKDQGIVKSPVRIGPDCWLGTRVTVLRGVTVGRGCVLAAHAVVRTDAPDHSVVVGVPGRVVKNRAVEYDRTAAHRAALADIVRKQQEATRQRLTGAGPASTAAPGPATPANPEPASAAAPGPTAPVSTSGEGGS